MKMENQYKPEGELYVLVNLLKQGGKFPQLDELRFI